jgi:hypothetical protein
MVLLFAVLSVPGLAQSLKPEGFWISEDLTPGGLGITLRFSSNGQVQATAGRVLKLQWKILEDLEDGYQLSLSNPYRPDDSSTVELRHVDWGEGTIILRSTTGGTEATLKLVSKGLQGDDPEFLGRWTGSIENVSTIWDFTGDGFVWMRSPSRIGLGTYRMKGEKIVFEWPGKWPPVVSARIEGDKLVCKGKKKSDNKTFLTPDAAVEKAMTPKLE